VQLVLYPGLIHVSPLDTDVVTVPAIELAAPQLVEERRCHAGKQHLQVLQRRHAHLRVRVDVMCVLC
jgi:hypothetical protein